MKLKDNTQCTVDRAVRSDVVRTGTTRESATEMSDDLEARQFVSKFEFV